MLYNYLKNLNKNYKKESIIALYQVKQLDAILMGKIFMSLLIVNIFKILKKSKLLKIV